MGVCRGCGVSLEKLIATCPYCGRTNEEYHPPEDTKSKSSTTLCPYCHLSDRTEKVTEIRRHDIHQIDGTIPVSHTATDKDGRSYSYTSHEKFSGTQSSDLANDLTPPNEPQLPKKHSSGTWWLLVALIMPGGELVGLPILGIIRNEPSLGGAAIGLIFGLALWVFLWSRWKKRFNREIQVFPNKTVDYIVNHNEWESAIKRWQQLYYCYRDGQVFVPGCGDSMQVDKITSYLYQRGEKDGNSIVCPKHLQSNRIIPLYDLFQDYELIGSVLANNNRSMKESQKVLAPPSIPDYKLGFGFYFGWWFLGYISIAWIFTIFIWWKAYKKALDTRRKPLKVLMDTWHSETRVWKRLVYCLDCDIVFDPQTERVYDFAGNFSQYFQTLLE